MNVSVVTLVPSNADAIVYVNGEVITGAKRLRSGDRIILGDNHVFRFNNPSEVRRDRKRKSNKKRSMQSLLHNPPQQSQQGGGQHTRSLSTGSSALSYVSSSRRSSRGSLRSLATVGSRDVSLDGERDRDDDAGSEGTVSGGGGVPYPVDWAYAIREVQMVNAQTGGHNNAHVLGPLLERAMTPTGPRGGGAGGEDTSTLESGSEGGSVIGGSRNVGGVDTKTPLSVSIQPEYRGIPQQPLSSTTATTPSLSSDTTTSFPSSSSMTAATESTATSPAYLSGPGLGKGGASTGDFSSAFIDRLVQEMEERMRSILREDGYGNGPGSAPVRVVSESIRASNNTTGTTNPAEPAVDGSGGASGGVEEADAGVEEEDLSVAVSREMREMEKRVSGERDRLRRMEEELGAEVEALGKRRDEVLMNRRKRVGVESGGVTMDPVTSEQTDNEVNVGVGPVSESIPVGLVPSPSEDELRSNAERIKAMEEELLREKQRMMQMLEAQKASYEAKLKKLAMKRKKKWHQQQQQQQQQYQHLQQQGGAGVVPGLPGLLSGVAGLGISSSPGSVATGQLNPAATIHADDHLKPSPPTDRAKALAHAAFTIWRSRRFVRLTEQLLSSAVLVKEANVIAKELSKSVLYELVVLDEGYHVHATSFWEAAPASGGMGPGSIANRAGAVSLDVGGGADASKEVLTPTSVESSGGGVSSANSSSQALTGFPQIGIRVLDGKHNSTYYWPIELLRDERIHRMRSLYNFVAENLDAAAGAGSSGSNLNSSGGSGSGGSGMGDDASGNGNKPSSTQTFFFQRHFANQEAHEAFHAPAPFVGVGASGSVGTSSTVGASGGGATPAALGGGFGINGFGFRPWFTFLGYGLVSIRNLLWGVTREIVCPVINAESGGKTLGYLRVVVSPISSQRAGDGVPASSALGGGLETDEEDLGDAGEEEDSEYYEDDEGDESEDTADGRNTRNRKRFGQQHKGMMKKQQRPSSPVHKLADGGDLLFEISILELSGISERDFTQLHAQVRLSQFGVFAEDEDAEGAAAAADGSDGAALASKRAPVVRFGEDVIIEGVAPSELEGAVSGGEALASPLRHRKSNSSIRSTSSWASFSSNNWYGGVHESSYGYPVYLSYSANKTGSSPKPPTERVYATEPAVDFGDSPAQFEFSQTIRLRVSRAVHEVVTKGMIRIEVFGRRTQHVSKMIQRSLETCGVETGDPLENREHASVGPQGRELVEAESNDTLASVISGTDEDAGSTSIVVSHEDIGAAAASTVIPDEDTIRQQMGGILSGKDRPPLYPGKSKLSASSSLLSSPASLSPPMTRSNSPLKPTLKSPPMSPLALPPVARNDEEPYPPQRHDILAHMQILELSNTTGEFKDVPVQLQPVVKKGSKEPTTSNKLGASDETGNFLLRQGLQRRIVVRMSHTSGREFPWKRVSNIRLGNVRRVDDQGRVIGEDVSSPATTAQKLISLMVPEKQRIQVSRDGRCILQVECAWDSSLHESVHLNKVTPKGSRILMSMEWDVEMNPLPPLQPVSGGTLNSSSLAMAASGTPTAASGDTAERRTGEFFASPFFGSGGSGNINAGARVVTPTTTPTSSTPRQLEGPVTFRVDFYVSIFDRDFKLKGLTQSRLMGLLSNAAGFNASSRYVSRLSNIFSVIVQPDDSLITPNTQKERAGSAKRSSGRDRKAEKAVVRKKRRRREWRRIDTRSKYVRGEECLSGWQPRGQELVFDYWKAKMNVRWKEEVERVRQMVVDELDMFAAATTSNLSSHGQTLVPISPYGRGSRWNGNGAESDSDIEPRSGTEDEDAMDRDGDKAKDRILFARKCLDLWRKRNHWQDVGLEYLLTDKRPPKALPSAVVGGIVPQAPSAGSNSGAYSSNSWLVSRTQRHHMDEELRWIAVVKLERPSGPVSKRGWMFSPEDSGDSWVKRWFVIRRPYLLVYANPTETDEIGCVNLADVTIQYSRDLWSILQRDHVFALYTKYYSILLQAGSEEEMKDWVSVIDPLHFGAVLSRHGRVEIEGDA
ncbi:kinesin-like protein Klp8 [Quaeritorhiza haematococci]|nr:kinesin-like protein Klp8 [Quaeritorhiza haematococci]